MNKLKITRAVIVEGRYDKIKLDSIIDALIIPTDGFGVFKSDEKKQLLTRLAKERVDIIIGCSHQRSDTHQALEIINRFLAYNTNAYVVRSSVSLGEDSSLGGCSCVIAPNGDVLIDMKNRAGYETVEIDPKKKYNQPDCR